MEWVSKRSSRIWRGSLAGEVWKYLSNGAWAPKAANAAKQQMSRKTSGGRRRKRQATGETLLQTRDLPLVPSCSGSISMAVMPERRIQCLRIILQSLLLWSQHAVPCVG